MISIIGAGPIGCYCGHLLAKAGQQVQIFEEHKEIGLPIQCTGIVTKDIFNFIKFHKKIFINKLNKVELKTKNKKIIIPIEDYVLDRKLFDQHMANLAKKAGCKIYLNKRFVYFKHNHAIIKNLKNNSLKKTKTDILIGADGPNSIVNKTFFNNNYNHYKGIQVRATINLDKNIYQTFFGNDFQKFFGWIVPENNNIARIGLAAKSNHDYYFNNFIKKLKIKKIIAKQAGLIPIYNPKAKLQKNNIYLIGDAASQIKSTTGGGIIPGLKAAKILASSIIKNRDYEKELKKLNRELWVHLKIRKVMDKFQDKDYDKLLNLLNKKNTKRLFSKINRDNLIKILPKIILTEPRLLYYLKFLP